jgi:hypothetical protein
MNRYITYCARAKLRRLLEKTPGAFAVSLVAGRHGGFEIGFLFSRNENCAIIICNAPYIYTDDYTMTLLNDGCIDFSYPEEEFIITREPSVIHTNA